MATNHALRATTRHGVVAGELIGGIATFRSIPFAGPIGGPARFAQPQLPERWSGVRRSTTLAPRVPQVPDRTHCNYPYLADYLFGRSPPLATSEDGLYLNLWTPSLDADARRPVLFWLHGGGFTTGAATRPREDGLLLSKRGDVVVVSPSHRLGALGYLHLEGIAALPNHSANVGLLDIVAALRWVHDNIREFGGDPDNVTIMGESGGGMKVSALLAMPSAKDLFHRAVCLGGALMSGFFTQALTPNEATSITKKLIEQIGCRPDELANQSLETLIDAQMNMDAWPVSWRPVIDGITLPDAPDRIVESGGGANVPTIIGTAAHEADFISKLGPAFAAKEPSGLAPLLGNRVLTIAETYRHADTEADNHELSLRMLTDGYFRIPSIRLAEKIATSGSAAFMYLFDWTQPSAPFHRSTHGSEATVIFGHLETTGFTRGFEEAQHISDLMQGALTTFMRSGDPNHAGFPTWPRYTAERRETMVFSSKSKVVEDPEAERRLAWS